MRYDAPRWLPGGHAQTIWPALFARRTAGSARPQYRRERWRAPDGDFVDVDFLHDAAVGTSARLAEEASPAIASPAPLLVLFHGLEGSSRSHYAEAFADVARIRGWRFAVPHFRGCSGEINHAPRAYHSGDHEEIGWILARLAQSQSQSRSQLQLQLQLQSQAPSVLTSQQAGESRAPLLAVGVSLGGNALLRWAAEAGAQACRHADAVAAVSSPIDLAAGGAAIGRGFNRQVYTRMFLRTMVPKALAKLQQHPGLFDRQALLAARDLYAFDNVFTAPLHGFRDTEDYWRRASAQPLLGDIRIPALVLNALNDPFVPAESLPRPGSVPAPVTLWQPAHGGHVGFAQGAWPGQLHGMPQQVCDWLARHGGAA
ncbi:MAG: alpha/beta fold hydrolase, partial [Comamonadaceae bacterium]